MTVYGRDINLDHAYMLTAICSKRFGIFGGAILQRQGFPPLSEFVTLKICYWG